MEQKDNTKNKNNQLSLIIYYHYIYKIGGIESWIYNMCQHLNAYYNLTVLYDHGDIKQLKRLDKITRVIQRDINKTYECDVILYASHLNAYPDNIIANKKISVVHSDYTYYKDLIDNYIIGDRADQIVCVSDRAALSLKEVCNKESIVIPNILNNKNKTNKILHLVSFTRLSKEKGYDRMCILINMLKKKNVKFDWKIFSDIDNFNIEKIQCPEVIFMKPTLDTYDYIVDADYLVQLSDTEAFCYSVHEALQYGTPVLVTDIDVFKNVVKNGYNGYKFDLNMSNVDIYTLINNIPNNFKYDDKIQEIKSQWFSVIGKPIECDKDIDREKVKVEVISEYYDLELNKFMKIGDKFITTVIRAYELCGYDNNAHIKLCKII